MNKHAQLKLFVLVLLLSFFSVNYTVAQEKLVTIKVENVSLQDVFRTIEKQTTYRFSYRNIVIDTTKNITISKTNASVSSILDEALEGRDLTYTIVSEKSIVISDKKQTPASGNQPVKSVSGVVKDHYGDPVIGASIVEKGTTNGMITDMDGNFNLTVSDRAVLHVSYIGYTEQDIPTAGKDYFVIQLEENNKMLDEVVVIGYGSISKKELTSAVSHISSKDMLRIGTGNPAMQIQGKVAGVMIDNTASADPNGWPNIQIRGVSSRSAGLGPLVVIDGVPGGSMDNINENDIESIDILKDGAASAIYGTRGSNGVIVITTKKGAADGVVRTSYTGFVNIATPIRELKVLSADEFKEHNRGDDYGADTDWFDELTKIGVSHSHTFQITGGNAKNNYRGTVDIKNSEGIDLRSSKREVGARLTLNHTAKSDLYNVVLNVAPRTLRYDNSDYGVFWQALTINPTMPVMDPTEPGKYYTMTAWDTYNPVETLTIEENGAEKKIFEWDATFKLNLLPLLYSTPNHSLTSQVTIAQQIIDTDGFFYRPSVSTREILNGNSGSASRKYDKNRQESFEWLVNYIFDKDKHNLKVMGGYSYQYFVNSGFNAENRDFASDLLSYNNLQSGTYNSEVVGRLGMGSYKNDSKLIAFFGRASYNYADKYFATFSLRYEGSSKFGANNKWGYFPAFSAGWRMSEEHFMKDIGWINELKIRGDFGVTGNQNFDSYRSLATMQGYDLVYYQGRYITGWSFNKNPNPDLKWEKGKNWNIGVDFSLFSNRFYGTVNYYNRKQQDLLGDYAVPLPPFGEPRTFVNVGTMKNSGVEIELTWDAVKNRNFTYAVGVVGSTSDNKFVSFSNQTYEGQSFYWLSSFPSYPGNPGPLQRIEEGERIGNFYTFEYAGLDDEGKFLIYSKDNEVISIDQGTDDDKRIVGNGLPKFMLSTTHNFRYKNWDLLLYFRGNFGFQIYDAHTMYYGLQSAAVNTNVLRSAYDENAAITDTNKHNSYFVHNGNFLKLDVATLGYNWKVDSKWLESVRVYFTGRNLFTISAFKGLDMDAFAVNGMEPGVSSSKTSYYPASRQYLFGFQLNF